MDRRDENYPVPKVMERGRCEERKELLMILLIFHRLLISEMCWR
uniref:Uncharacterized protein n=1 Tax=Anguilla anguilla TaxID=7936 RepID=A0A0E9THT4_ANGAN